MNLKDKFLNTKRLDELSEREFVELMNNYGMKDEEVARHYQELTKNFDYEESDRKFKKELEHGFEVPWLLRKNK